MLPVDLVIKPAVPLDPLSRPAREKIARPADYYFEMQITITTWTGNQLDGVLLAASGLLLRVAISGFDDAVEYRLRGGQWFSDQGEFVEIRPYSALAEDDPDSPRTAGGLAVSTNPAGLLACAPAWVN